MSKTQTLLEIKQRARTSTAVTRVHNAQDKKEIETFINKLLTMVFIV